MFTWSQARARILTAAILVLSLSGCTMWEQKQSSAWSNATGAEQFERLFWQEIKARNWTEVERRLAPAFVEATASGVRDREQTLERLKALGAADYSMGDLEVRPDGADMVVAYTMTLRASSGGETTLHMMTVWQQVKGGWVAIAHSEASATAP